MEMRILRPQEIIPVSLPSGVVTLDGEREFAFHRGDKVKVWLDLDGPFTVDVSRVMQVAAERGIFTWPSPYLSVDRLQPGLGA
jgi:hypothetical protein